MAGEAIQIEACANYDCRSRQKVLLSEQNGRQLQQLFKTPAPDAASERQRLAEAIALLEQWVGEVTGTKADKGRNQATGEAGQLDCVAESTNSDHYLRLLAERGWLKWHRVAERQKRAPLIFDVHWAAVIEELATGKQYAVDSWFFDNGRAPFIAPLEEWRRGSSPD